MIKKRKEFKWVCRDCGRKFKYPTLQGLATAQDNHIRWHGRENVVQT